ncbi:hypothetical protein N7532_007247 [Penicillium argentinense]|uniref:O-methyltransferase n=1 Tax=Penicillium argentinense TaxID=1131581 RepID=A0A9W9F7A8_9EURO|nr:uncharacterized protein N7532_007247 [Penicillium argentinense]KAJ5094956.1 hypothetical protein N7532_007247 [Penicillium argentinense]
MENALACKSPYGPPPHETTPRFISVDAYIKTHLHCSEKGYYDVLENINHDSLAAGAPDIACSATQAKFLMLLARACNAKNILEVGTMGGYSAAWMSTADPEVKVTTIERRPEFVELAAKNLAKAGLSSRVEILTGLALEVMPALLTEMRRKERAPFDFVFIDANKEDGLEYFTLAVEMARPRAIIIVDNVIWNGKIASADEAEKDARVKGIRKLIEGTGVNDLVDATAIQTVGEKNYDGFLFAVKN